MASYYKSQPKGSSSAPPPAGAGSGFYNHHQQQQQQQNPSYYGSNTHNQQQQQQQQQFYGGGFNTPQNNQTQQPQPTTSTEPTTPTVPNFWNPAAASAVVSAATGGKGLSEEAVLGIASSAWEYSVAAGTAHAIPVVGRLMGNLRVYFAVDNRYVKSKIQRILFPFFYKQWRRMEIDPSITNPQMKSNEGSDDAANATVTADPQYALPVHDENATDLYLPMMSLVSYVLLCAICYGTSGKFTPEVLPEVTSRCMITQTLEVLLMKLGIYMMQVPFPFLDLFSITGYKYLGLCINLLVGIASSVRGYWIAMVYTAGSVGYFVLKYMANNIPKRTADAGPKREFIVLGCAASQFGTMW
eukprot:CAMPEP_0172492510 /NCGR_PEP_ID=MMETSP1066-20121228/23697_1 /TAXON_ID=671091 /ORGANISM="Coscinodiscus wailesii, Strain CCMP2513" /LENGTH=355 /DNA_ID=CAMNT_0013262185 /DNA_START=124 /DNA_END=1188 /DNA_ORIENTATION=+